MERSEAKSAAKALYLQSAAMAGFEVTEQSPERIAALVEGGFPLVAPGRQAEAVANLLRLVAWTIQLASESGATVLSESSVDAAHEKLCDPPVYPFGP